MTNKTLNAVTVALNNEFGHRQEFTGDGTTTTFTVTGKPPVLSFVMVDDVVKKVTTDYSYAPTTGALTFVTAPANKAKITVYHSEYHYYVETVMQELKPPCFTVDVINPIERSTNKVHYYRTMPVVVHFFTDEQVNHKKTCYAIGERALMALEYITIDDRLIRGEGMEMTMVDDVLQLFITYGYWTDKSEDESDILMETETLDVEVQ